MLTEEEAKLKICPHLPVDVVLENNVHRVEYYAKCRASACMAWRWVAEEVDTRVPVKVEGEPPPDDDSWRLSPAGNWWLRGHGGKGYCGLAGHPFPAFVVQK